MIEQVTHWRKELYRIAINLEKRYRQKRWTDRSEFSLEKQIFIGFYIIRKIMESKKCNKTLHGTNYRIYSSPYSQKSGIMQNINHPLNDYNLPVGELELISIKELCNQFIHSYHFVSAVPFGHQLVGFYFVSHNLRKEKIYYIQLIIIIEIFISFFKDQKIELKLDTNKIIGIKNINAI